MINVFYYEPQPDDGYAADAATAYYFDEHTMTVLPATDERVVAFRKGGGAIQPYQPPPEPLPLPSLRDLPAELDMVLARINAVETRNRALEAELAEKGGLDLAAVDAKQVREADQTSLKE